MFNNLSFIEKKELEIKLPVLIYVASKVRKLMNIVFSKFLDQLNFDNVIYLKSLKNTCLKYDRYEYDIDGVIGKFCDGYNFDINVVFKNLILNKEFKHTLFSNSKPLNFVFNENFQLIINDLNIPKIYIKEKLNQEVNTQNNFVEKFMKLLQLYLSTFKNVILDEDFLNSILVEVSKQFLTFRIGDYYISAYGYNRILNEYNEKFELSIIFETDNEELSRKLTSLTLYFNLPQYSLEVNIWKSDFFGILTEHTKIIYSIIFKYTQLHSSRSTSPYLMQFIDGLEIVISELLKLYQTLEILHKFL